LNTQQVIQGGLRVGGLAVGSPIQLYAVSGLVASTTHTIAGGTPLKGEVNEVSTVANSGDAVTLLALQPGQSQAVFNDGANPLAVYPASVSYAIDGGSAGAAATLTNAKRAVFFCTAANIIKSAQLGVASA